MNGWERYELQRITELLDRGHINLNKAKELAKMCLKVDISARSKEDFLRKLGKTLAERKSP